MAAEIVSDDQHDDGNQDEVVPQSLTTPSDASAPPQDKPKSKFAGKTPAEIEAAYEALEHRFGSQGAELGELRKLTDHIIRSSLPGAQTKPAPQQQQEPSTTDPDAEFFINPRAAIKKVLEEDEVLRELRHSNAETQQERAQRVLKSKHADTDDIIKDPAFQEWVKASKVRTALFVQAHQRLDIDAADELFSTYKELRGAKAKQADAAKDAGNDIVEAQKLAAGAPSGTTNTGESGRKPVYSRRKIMELMIHNPDEYAARNDEFLAAYAEGRVKP
jgi:hypothetical protein